MPSRTYSVPERQTDAVSSIAAIEWGIDAIRADDVWSTYGVRGDGIVVANIDTGVQFDHPALASQYRGNTASGVTHDYYWNTAFGTTQEAFVTLATIDSRSVSQGLLLKVGDGDIANAAAITVTYDARARGVTVSALRANARSWTLYPRRPVTFANGDQLGARVTNAGVVQISRNGSPVGSVTLNAADGAYFNGRGGKIGISMLAASSALPDDFGGGTTTP